MPVYRVQNISWAAEGAGVLPCEATVECAGVNDIADTLSDHYGWLVTGFEVEESLPGDIHLAQDGQVLPPSGG